MGGINGRRSETRYQYAISGCANDSRIRFLTKRIDAAKGSIRKRRAARKSCNRISRRQRVREAAGDLRKSLVASTKWIRFRTYISGCHHLRARG